MKKLLIILCCAVKISNGQPINPGISGQNANLTQTVGINNNTGGKLDYFWGDPNFLGYPNYFKESGAKYVRYSGIYQEDRFLIDGVMGNTSMDNIEKTVNDYYNKAITLQNNGQVPMFLMPLKLAGSLNNFTLVAAQVALLVKEVNTKLVAAGKQPVLHWLYPNEPNLQGGSHGYDGTDAAQKIHDYTAAFWNAVYAPGNTCWNPAWGTPVFIGPELAGYDNYQHMDYTTNPATVKVNRLIEQLLGQYNQLAPTSTITSVISEHDIRPFITVFSWHLYPFDDESKNTVGIPDANRNNVINVLAKPNSVVKYGLPGNFVRPLIGDINEVNGWINNPAIGLAITEANICHINDVGVGAGSNTVVGTDDLISGNGSNSFIAGQFYSEMAAICMQAGNMQYLNFWSAVEGCGTCTVHPNYESNVGFINTDPNKFGALGGRKSTYHHYKMMADNFKGTFYSATSVSITGVTTNTNVKAYAAKDGDKIAVMILNQRLSTDPALSFNVSLNGGTSTSSLNVVFNIPGGGSTGYASPATATGSISGESTVLLLFKCGAQFYERWDYKSTDAAPVQTQSANPTVVYNITSHSLCPGQTIQMDAVANATAFA